MSLIVATISTFVVFIAGDAVVIRNIMRPLFKAYLGDGMLDTLRLGSAALFYLVHVGGIAFLALAPALRERNTIRAAVNGAAVGLVAYSCYEMTSWTIMRDWDVTLVLADTLWGTVISGLAAYAGARAGLSLSAKAPKTSP
jgi:uncharacterized membrane protein